MGRTGEASLSRPAPPRGCCQKMRLAPPPPSTCSTKGGRGAFEKYLPPSSQRSPEKNEKKTFLPSNFLLKLSYLQKIMLLNLVCLHFLPYSFLATPKKSSPTNLCQAGPSPRPFRPQSTRPRNSQKERFPQPGSSSRLPSRIPLCSPRLTPCPSQKKRPSYKKIENRPSGAPCVSTIWIQAG